MSKFLITIVEPSSKLTAVKTIKENSNLDLKESKEIVDKGLAFEYDEEMFAKDIAYVKVEFEYIDCRIKVEPIN